MKNELEQIAFGACAQCTVFGQLFGVGGYCAHCHIGHLETMVKAQAQLIEEALPSASEAMKKCRCPRLRLRRGTQIETAR